MATSKLINSTTTMATTMIMDGMGHPTETQLTADNPPGTDYVDTTYDGLGRIYTVSNPYRSGDTMYWTTYNYDPLNRMTGKVNQDNSGEMSRAE
ncbi:MAG: hypothetical protein ACYDBH_22320 [Acidobacteriaceae bacterium]